MAAARGSAGSAVDAATVAMETVAVMAGVRVAVMAGAGAGLVAAVPERATGRVSRVAQMAQELTGSLSRVPATLAVGVTIGFANGRVRRQPR